jgi:hypothetical protein
MGPKVTLATSSADQKNANASVHMTATLRLRKALLIERTFGIEARSLTF